MKKSIKTRIFTFAIIGVLFMLLGSCRKNDNTPTLLTVTDIDGNVYHTVTIGSQVWMVENLKTTKYNDNTSIPLVTDSASWISLTTPGYCWYNNDAANNKNVYGALYNWYTVNTGKLAPAGWHVPTHDEWTTMITYLGNDSVAGGKMKSTGTLEAGTGLWHTPNSGANNKSGFTALPGGYRAGTASSNGMSANIGELGIWWTATEYDNSHSWNYYLVTNIVQVNYGYQDGEKTYGYSVRCVKD